MTVGRTCRRRPPLTYALRTSRAGTRRLPPAALREPATCRPGARGTGGNCSTDPRMGWPAGLRHRRHAWRISISGSPYPLLRAAAVAPSALQRRSLTGAPARRTPSGLGGEASARLRHRCRRARIPEHTVPHAGDQRLECHRSWMPDNTVCAGYMPGGIPPWQAGQAPPATGRITAQQASTSAAWPPLPSALARRPGLARSSSADIGCSGCRRGAGRGHRRAAEAFESTGRRHEGHGHRRRRRRRKPPGCCP